MAELSVPQVSLQIRMVARLRWLLFKNSLRTIKGRLEAVSTGILWLMMSGLVFGGGIFFGISSYWIIRNGHTSWLTGLLWIVFVFWQLYPIFAASVGAQFDFANLLRFPLRFGSFFALSLFYGLFDPGAVASVVWLFAMWIGITLARPALFLWTFVVILAFAALNLFLARMILAWLEKWLARRRTREILGFIFILIIISFQLIGPAVQHFQNDRVDLQVHWMLSALPVANALPAGVAARSLRAALSGALLPAAYSLLFVLVYAAAFLWFFRVRLIAQYRGENLSETTVASRSSNAAGASGVVTVPLSRRTVSLDLEIPGIPRSASAIFGKELRYALRSGPMILNVLIPIILVILLSFTFHQPGKANPFHRMPQMIFPIAIAYTFLIQMNFVFNSFAFDGTGIQLLILAPVRFRDVLVGKNLFLAAVSLIQALLVWLAVSWIYVPPQLVIVAATFTALLYGSLANFALGNILSVCYPRRLEFGVFRQKRQAGVTMAVAFVAQAVLIGLGAVVFLVTAAFRRPALAIFIFLALSVLTAIAYRISLGRLDQLALNRRETLTAELCRQE